MLPTSTIGSSGAGRRTPAVSVVVPSYNHERFIREAMDSIQRQTLEDLQIIVVDDGSVDGSPEILREIAAKDPRVELTLRANGGSHAAINQGLDLARGDWVAILNSDDRWDPDRLASLVRNAISEKSEFAISGTRLIDAEGNEIADAGHWWNLAYDRMLDRYVRHGLEDALLYGNLAVSTSNFLFRRSLASSLGPFKSLRYNLDWEFILRALIQGVRISYVPERLLDYRLHGDNAILGGMPIAAIEALQLSRTVLQKHHHVPEATLLSLYRHQRLLRRHLSDAVRRLDHSYDEIERHRDALVELTRSRQVAIDHEREQVRQESSMLRDGMSALEIDRDRLADLLTSRQTMIDLERTRHGNQLTAMEADAARQYARHLYVAIDRDRLALEASRYRSLVLAHEAESPWKKILERLVSRWRRPKPVRATSGLGSVRKVSMPADDVPVQASIRGKVGVHVHLYYLDLAPELIGYLESIPAIEQLVITGPWSESDVAPLLEPIRARCTEIFVDSVPNRGKDVGGFLHALRGRRLLECDYILKIHSKKSSNPPSYFEAISAVFGQPIADGDQWRQMLARPLVGCETRATNILNLLEHDPTVGMVGARGFITTAAEADAELYAGTCDRLGVAQGLPFVAGTMFWARSSILSPLVTKGASLGEFEVDSRRVEGGLEHSYERVFAALALSAGFDLVGVD